MQGDERRREHQWKANTWTESQSENVEKDIRLLGEEEVKQQQWGVQIREKTGEKSNGGVRKSRKPVSASVSKKSGAVETKGGRQTEETASDGNKSQRLTAVLD